MLVLHHEKKKDGSGRKIRFPVKLTLRLCFRSVYVKHEGRLVKKEGPIERCSVYSCAEACTVDDLN